MSAPTDHGFLAALFGTFREDTVEGDIVEREGGGQDAFWLGRSQPLDEWIEQAGIPKHTVAQRLAMDATLADALLEPLHGQRTAGQLALALELSNVRRTLASNPRST